MQVKLTAREAKALAAKPTNNLEAYDAYLRGLAFDAHSAYSNAAQRNAITSYERAVQRDPAFVLAWARLSRADAALYFIRADQTPARRDAARRALENAQELNPNLPETQVALGYYQYWVLRDYGLAKDTFGHLREMLPGSSDILYALGLVTRRQGGTKASRTLSNASLSIRATRRSLAIPHGLTPCCESSQPRQSSTIAHLKLPQNDLDLVAAKAGIYQADGNLKEATTLLTGINVQSPIQPFLTKMTQLRLERNHNEAVRLLQARQTQFQFASESDKATNDVVLTFAQRLAGDTAGAKATAGQARNALEPLCREQPDNSFLRNNWRLLTPRSGRRRRR